jgi:hypothetical protein
MSAQHTQGRLEANDKRSKGGGGFSLFAGGQYIGFVSDSDAITDWEANARRLAACWNACEGIEDPENVIPQLRRANDLVQQLEPLRIQRDELLAALRIAKTALVQWHVPGNRYAALDVINAAIAKVTGQEGGAA